MPTPDRPEIDALTGIRGIAAVLVATYHYFLPLMPPGSIVYRLFSRGYLYVDLFFLLSGYVMALNYGRMFAERRRWSDVMRFFWKRFARVYPLYLCVLVALAAGYWAVYGDFADHHSWIVVPLPHPARDIALNILLLQSWGLATGIVGQAWSISTEAAAYLAFPWLVPLVLRLRPTATAIVVAAFATLPAVAVWLGTGDGAYHAGALDLWTGPPALLRCLGGFTLGMALYRIAAWPGIRFAFSDTFGVAVILAAIACRLAALPDLALYPPFVLLILCLAGNTGLVGRAFACRPVYLLGLVSYSLYLLHVYLGRPMYELQKLLAAWMPGSLAWALSATLAAACLIGVSAAAYVLIERPARRVLSGFARRGVSARLIAG